MLNQNPLLTAAIKYLENGMAVIPLKPKSKEPLIPWKIYQSQLPTMTELNEWFQDGKSNIGIVTGKISNLSILDLDGENGLKYGQLNTLDTSLISLTGKGKQLWYRYHEGLGSSASEIAPNVDVRSDGGYIVAPPSIHPNGLRYRFQNPLPSDFARPAFPTHILTQNVPQPITDAERNQPGWIAKALEEMTYGNIDDTLFKICSRLRNDGYTQKDATYLLLPHARQAGAIEGHLEDKIRNVWERYESPKSRINGSISNETITIHSFSNANSQQLYSSIKQSTELSAGLGTGYKHLDSFLHGGLKSSRLFTIAARTGTGKTNWLIGASKHFCEQSKKVLIFSTETPFNEIWDRYKLLFGRDSNCEHHKLFICDSFAPNIEKVEEALKEVMPDLFIFDHINHVSEDQRELGTFMQGLNFLRRKYDCAGIVAAQLNRAADWVDLKTGEKVTPRMSMIKGSGTIEQASSRVLLLSEIRVTPECTEIIGNLDKNDRGPKGIINFGIKTNPYRMVEL